MSLRWYDIPNQTSRYHCVHLNFFCHICKFASDVKVNLWIPHANLLMLLIVIG